VRVLSAQRREAGGVEMPGYASFSCSTCRVFSMRNDRGSSPHTCWRSDVPAAAVSIRRLPVLLRTCAFQSPTRRLLCGKLSTDSVYRDGRQRSRFFCAALHDSPTVLRRCSSFRQPCDANAVPTSRNYSRYHSAAASRASPRVNGSCSRRPSACMRAPRSKIETRFCCRQLAG